MGLAVKLTAVAGCGPFCIFLLLVVVFVVMFPFGLICWSVFGGAWVSWSPVTFEKSSELARGGLCHSL